MEIHYEGMLTNLAMMSRHPEALPNHIRLADGVVQVNDQVGFGRAGGFTILGSSDLGIETLGPSGRRRVSEQWGTDAITDPERLYDLQSLYRTALGLSPLPPPNSIAYLRAEPREGASASDEDSEDEQERQVPLPILLTDVPPPGWYHLGSKREVPNGTRYVGRWNDRYAWVTPDGFAALTRFTLTVLMVIKLQPGEQTGGSSGLAVTAGD